MEEEEECIINIRFSLFGFGQMCRAGSSSRTLVALGHRNASLDITKSRVTSYLLNISSVSS